MVRKNQKMKEALNWWNNILNDAGRSSFPIPKSDEDILAFYTDPAAFIMPPPHL